MISFGNFSNNAIGGATNTNLAFMWFCQESVPKGWTLEYVRRHGLFVLLIHVSSTRRAFWYDVDSSWLYHRITLLDHFFSVCVDRSY